MYPHMHRAQDRWKQRSTTSAPHPDDDVANKRAGEQVHWRGSQAVVKRRAYSVKVEAHDGKECNKHKRERQHGRGHHSHEVGGKENADEATEREDLDNAPFNERAYTITVAVLIILSLRTTRCNRI